MEHRIIWNQIDCLIMDFDGVFTDNRVYLSETGEELVACNRGDGLGLGMLKKFYSMEGKELELLVLSKERNVVVQKRAHKLGIECKNGVDNKFSYLRERLKAKESIEGGRLRGVVYLGNDLNDLSAMSLCEFPVCPSDAHSRVRAASRLVLNAAGGGGCIRELIEVMLDLENMKQSELDRLL